MHHNPRDKGMSRNVRPCPDCLSPRDSGCAPQEPLVTFLECVMILTIPSPVGEYIPIFENVFDVVDFSPVPATVLRRVVVPPILIL